MAAVAGLCGLQDSPPGTAGMALHARVEGITKQVLEQALGADRTLVRTWAMRGAPYVVPTVDLPIFTTGVLPVDEEGRTNLIVGVRPALEDLPGGLDDYVAATSDAVRDVLSGQRLEINELGRQVAQRVERTLPEQARRVWSAEGPYGQGQPLGEGIIHFCIRILTLRQVLCFAPRRGRTAPFVLLSEWLDDLPELDAGQARRELVTRFLRAYGPSTATGLAGWLGVTVADAAAWWDLIDDDIVLVDVGGSPRWLLTEDLGTLEASREGTLEGVRFLPPGDPFLRLWDREVLVADPAHQQQLWRPLHPPGALLVDGDVVGTWRGRKSASRLDLTVEPFERLRSAVHPRIEDAAQALAPVRDAKKVTLTFGESA